jgi:hypothetical protein
VPTTPAHFTLKENQSSAMRRIIYVIGGVAVFLGSFFMTLWLTEPEIVVTPPKAADYRSITERLAAQRISSYPDLEKAAQNVGLHFSKEMKGAIDVAARVNEREVHMEGWLADPEGNSTPLSVLVFVGGPMVVAAQTKGERADVTNAMHLGFGAQQNVAFSFNFECRPGNQPVVMGLGKRNQYILLQSKDCP